MDSPVLALRGEDASGSFGILPGHQDYLTVLAPTVLRWRLPGGGQRFAAVGGGVLTLAGGLLHIACREALLGERLAVLEAEVHQWREGQRDQARRMRVEHLRLHTRAVRQLVQYLRVGDDTPFGEDEQP